MSRSGASIAAALTAVAALGFAAACKSPTSKNCGNGAAPPSLVGAYTLVSYTLGTMTAVAPPASGTLHFYANLYGYDVAVPGKDSTTHYIDSGSYNIVGATCLQELSVLGNPMFSGEFTVQGTTFHVSGTTGTQVAVSTWKKSP